MAEDYKTPEHSAYSISMPNLFKLRKRTGFKRIYRIEDSLVRVAPDVKPGSVWPKMVEFIDNGKEHTFET